MSSTSILPLDIQETIIDILAEESEKSLTGDQSALKTCSLVCQAFLPRCRKHIFASIELRANVHNPSAPYRALERLLSETPEIANYIRKLDYNFRKENCINPSIPESLKRISWLESLTVRHSRGRTLDWSNNPIRSTLLHLLHLPTLIRFELVAVSNFIISDLIPCVNLKHLALESYTTVANETTLPAAWPPHPIQLNEFVAGVGTATVITKLCTARRPNGQLVVDFRSLAKITLAFEKHNESEAAQELFRHCEKLVDVNISFWDPDQVKHRLADMLRPSVQTLKHIAVNLYVDGVEVDPLFGIPSELEAIRTGNIIESVTIRVLVRTDGNCRRGDDWGRLDTVLTSSAWFALKRVSLGIDISSDARSDNELEVALRKLPETQFPRLSTSKSILFDFEVNETVWA